MAVAWSRTVFSGRGKFEEIAFVRVPRNVCLGDVVYFSNACWGFAFEPHLTGGK